MARISATALMILAMIFTVLVLTMQIVEGGDVGAGYFGDGDGGVFSGVDETALKRRALLYYGSWGGYNGGGAAAPRYISYGALSRDRVPCSTAGRSYYGCRSSGPVNSYFRSCSRITNCLRDTN